MAFRALSLPISSIMRGRTLAIKRPSCAEPPGSAPPEAATRREVMPSIVEQLSWRTLDVDQMAKEGTAVLFLSDRVEISPTASDRLRVAARNEAQRRGINV